MKVYVESQAVTVTKKQELLLRQIVTGLKALKELQLTKSLTIVSRTAMTIDPSIYNSFKVFDANDVASNEAVPSLDKILKEG